MKSAVNASSDSRGSNIFEVVVADDAEGILLLLRLTQAALPRPERVVLRQYSLAFLLQMVVSAVRASGGGTLPPPFCWPRAQTGCTGVDLPWMVNGMNGIVVQAKGAKQERACGSSLLVFATPAANARVWACGQNIPVCVHTLLEISRSSLSRLNTAYFTSSTLPRVVAIMDETMLVTPGALDGLTAISECSGVFEFPAVDTKDWGMRHEDFILNDLCATMHSQHDGPGFSQEVCHVAARSVRIEVVAVKTTSVDAPKHRSLSTSSAQQGSASFDATDEVGGALCTRFATVAIGSLPQPTAVISAIVTLLADVLGTMRTAKEAERRATITAVCTIMEALRPTAKRLEETGASKVLHKVSRAAAVVQMATLPMARVRNQGIRS